MWWKSRHSQLVSFHIYLSMSVMITSAEGDGRMHSPAEWLEMVAKRGSTLHPTAAERPRQDEEESSSQQRAEHQNSKKYLECWRSFFKTALFMCVFSNRALEKGCIWCRQQRLRDKEKRGHYSFCNQIQISYRSQTTNRCQHLGDILIS